MHFGIALHFVGPTAAGRRLGCLVVTSWLALLTGAISAQEQIPPRIADKILPPTVLVRASTASGDIQGSGFLVFAKGVDGLVATNAHWVQHGANPSRQVQSVFASGTATQMPVMAQVVAVDQELDLAILRIRAPRLPNTLGSRAKDELTKGERVYLASFDEAVSQDAGPPAQQLPQPTPPPARPGRAPRRPDGGPPGDQTPAELSGPNQGPASATGLPAGPSGAARPFGAWGGLAERLPPATVRSAQVTDVTRDEFGNVMFARLDGGIDRGSSGGPVINARGNLVGIAVMKGDARPFDVVAPVARLEELLYGRVEKVVIRKGKDSKRKAEFLIDVELLDPIQQVKNVFVLVAPQADLPAAPLPRGKDGSPAEATDGMRGAKLAVANGHATGRVYADIRGAQLEPHVFQIRYVRGDGATRHTEVELLRETDEAAADKRDGEALAQVGQKRPPQLPQIEINLLPSGLTKLDLSAPLLEIPLPGQVHHVCLGASGRLLVMQFADKEGLSVLDLSTGRMAKEIPAPAGALITANAESLIVVSPADSSIQRWDLRRMRSERQASLPPQITPLAAAAGFASVGDLLILARDTRTVANVFLVLDATTLEVRRIPDVWQMQGDRTLDAAPRDDGGFTLPAVAVLPDVRLRGSANGHLFGFWSPSRKIGASLIVGNDSALACLPANPIGELLPMADDSAFGTAAGVFRPDLTERFGRPLPQQTRIVPSTHPRYYVEYAPNGAVENPPRVIDRATGEAVADLPPIREIDASVTAFALAAAGGLAWDERVYYLPEAHLLVTIPVSNDKLVLQSVAFLPEPISPQMVIDASGKRPTQPSAGPLRSLEERVWKDASGKFQITARLMRITDEKAVLLTAQGEKEVPLSRLSQEDRDYIERARPLVESSAPSTNRTP